MQTNPTALPGTVVHTADAGHARIDVIRAVGGWTVKAWQGSEDVAGWTCPYTSKRDAWEAFKHTAAVFEIYKTAQAIANRRNALAIERSPIATRLDRSRDPQARAAYTKQLD